MADQQGSSVALRLDAASVLKGLQQGAEASNKFTASVYKAGDALRQVQHAAGGPGSYAATASSAFADFARQNEKAERSTAGFTRSAMNSQQALFSLSYALQDATSVGGNFNSIVRASANNVQMLAVAMGASGPLVLGITAATAAVGFLGGRIQSTLDEAVKAARAAGGNIEEAIKGSITDRITGADAFRLLFTVRQRMGREDITIGQYEKLAALEKELVTRAKEYHDQVQLITDLRAAGIDVGEILKRQQREEATLLSEAVRERKSLLEQYRLTASSDGLRLAAIELQNEQLKRQIGLLHQRNRVDALAQRFGLERAPIPGRMEGRPPAVGGSMIEQERAKGLGSSLLDLRGPGMTAATAAAAQRDFDRQRTEEVKGFDQALQSLEHTINGGLSNGLFTLAAAMGEVAAGSRTLGSAGATALSALADLGMQTGRIAVATGFAIGGIKEALKSLNPAIAIGAGLTLIAVSSAVKASLSEVAGRSDSRSAAAASGLAPGYWRPVSPVGPAPPMHRVLPAPVQVGGMDRLTSTVADGNARLSDAVREQVPILVLDEFETRYRRYRQRVAMVR